MFRILFLLFLSVPLIELYLLIEVGYHIGALTTILLCLATAALGATLVRAQGLATLLAARREMDRGMLPAAHMLHGLMLAIAGILLLIPGFATDAFGFLLLVPAVRHRIAALMLPRIQIHQRNKDWIEGEVVSGEEKNRPEERELPR